MITFLAILKSARAHWRFLVLGALLAGIGIHIANDRRAVANARAAGYAQALTRAARVRVDTVDRVVARTDTVIKRVTQRIVDVDTLIEQVHDTVKAQFPEVAKALNACTALANDCATLRASVLTERTAWAERDTALRLTIVAQQDTNTRLKRRPSRLRALGESAAAFTLGIIIGKR